MKKHSNSLSDTIVNIVIYTFFIAFTLICIFPFYYLFINTISNNDLSSKGLVNFIPKGIHFTNYLEVLKIRGLGQAAFITLSRTVIGTALTVFASAFLGFLFTKKEMWGRKFWYRFVIITMYFNAGIMPWYITMMNLKLTNNFLAYVLPTIISPFNIILVKTFIEGIPESLQEAAEIDGAGLYTIFLKIVMPLIKPILATITIFSAVAQWNSFTDTLFLVTDSKLFTLQFVLYKYLNEASSLAALIKSSQSGIAAANVANMQTATSVRMTVSMIVVIPILFVYPYFQRHFVKGVMIGAVKG
ncbi:carbohydrate ABC transporter permease [Clostridium sp. YIM B02505]|uniref:Carbohydrate ABC transporter permease n=1 Tax=Clostridium yunnanense TaxID=2800325 RepID=A0ABS1ELD8_9CLOT|nr:carbohydrate ABC transporter permease [Clostridium yunnanense]MBK1810188.1 carbohydrate ABC transporter permease [Clostridium yunnanense]